MSQPDLFGRSEPHIRDLVYEAIEAGYRGCPNPYPPSTYFWSLHEEGRRACPRRDEGSDMTPTIALYVWACLHGTARRAA